MTIRDSAEDSAAAAGDVLELCKMVNEPAERWVVGLIIRLRVHERFLGVVRVCLGDASSVAERSHSAAWFLASTNDDRLSYGNVSRGSGTVVRGKR